MAPRTRAAVNSPVKKMAATVVMTAEEEEEEHEPVKILIAPKDVSNESRILSLSHPRDAVKKRFLFCHKTGLHEITKTTPLYPNSQSILFSSDNSANTEATQFSAGYVNKDAETLTATPFDIAFILLKYLAPETISSQKSLFQPLDDLLEFPDSNDRALDFILRNGRTFVEEAMSSICETTEAGDEIMFRYSEKKVLQLMLSKAQRVAASGLPASLEERFVTRTLEAPVLSIKTENSTLSVAVSESTSNDDIDASTVNDDSQSSKTTTAASAVFSETSIVTTSSMTTVNTPTSEAVTLQRTRVAFKFIASSYLPSYLFQRLEAAMSESDSPINFRPLDEELERLTILRAEVAASRSLTDFGRKRGLEDDEAAEIRAEKKKKQEEEEKRRKANESRGVRDLKKVNVAGMKKMSAFFTKKPTAPKAKT